MTYDPEPFRDKKLVTRLDHSVVCVRLSPELWIINAHARANRPRLVDRLTTHLHKQMSA